MGDRDSRVAWLFTFSKGQVVLLCLGIAGYTYGALFVALLLGRLVPRASGRDAVIAFAATLAVMETVASTNSIAFTWYSLLGVLVTLLVGGGLSSAHPPAP